MNPQTILMRGWCFEQRSGDLPPQRCGCALPAAVFASGTYMLQWVRTNSTERAAPATTSSTTLQRILVVESTDADPDGVIAPNHEAHRLVGGED
jgi:hypothetical protein